MARAKAAKATTKSKKRATEDDEDPPAKTRKGKAVVEDEDDEDTEEDADEDTDDDTDTDEDDSEDEADDDDEEESSDDDEEDTDTDEDEDSDDDEDADDEDDDARRTPKKKKSAGAQSAFSWDTDDAEGGGLPEGRVVLLNPRTRLGDVHDYPKDDPDGVPLFSLDAVPVDKNGKVTADPWEIHLSAGKAERIVPTDDGTDFQPAEGSKVRGLAKSSNTYLFVKSAEDAGLTKDKLREKGMRAFHGMEVDIARVPQPQRKGLAARDDDEEGGFEKTYPHIAQIHCFPWKSKGEAARTAAIAALKSSKKGGKRSTKKEGTRGPKAAAADKTPVTKPTVKKVKTVKPSDADIISAAETAVTTALNTDKFIKKGLPKDDIYPSAFQHVIKHPARVEIMKLIESEDFYTDDARPWFWDERLERIIRV